MFWKFGCKTMGCFGNSSFRKFVLVLCFWGLAFSTYFLFDSFGARVHQRHFSLKNPEPVRVVSTINQTALLRVEENRHVSAASMHPVLEPAEQSNSTKHTQQTYETKHTEQSDDTKQTEQSDDTKQTEQSDDSKQTEKSDNTKQTEQSGSVKATEQSSNAKHTQQSNNTKPTEQSDNTKPAEQSASPVAKSAPQPAQAVTENNATSTTNSKLTVATARNGTERPASTNQTSPSSSTKYPPSPGNSSPSSPTVSGVSEKPTKLLCVRFTGRLGNELFEYTSTLGLALTLNRIPVFLGSTILVKVLKTFRVSSLNISRSELEQRCNKAKGIGEASCCKYNEEMAKLDPQYDYRVGMYLQSYRYFENHQAEIRQAITFNDAIQTKAGTLVRELRQKYNSPVLVGVHIRHGDMASERNQKLGYPVASPEYINKSLSYFMQLFPNCTFVVASDSVQWCKDNFPKRFTNVHFLGQNEPAVDMMVLAAMDHVITSFGSFSWWIGYLNPGKTVYMKDFIRANTHIGKCFNAQGRDYIYPGWIPL